MRQVLAVTKGQRHAGRDYALMLLMYRRGLRTSEACGMLLNHVNLEGLRRQVVRVRNGLSTKHPLRADELRAIERSFAARPESAELHREQRSENREAVEAST